MMGLSIKDRETEDLVRLLAERTGAGVTGAIKLAVRNQLARDAELEADKVERRRASVREIQARWAAIPSLMSDEEVDRWMYDDDGLPH